MPVCLGDTYQDKRVVGTTPDMFDELTYSAIKHYEFAEGQNFEPNDFFNAVAGAAAAKQTGLKVGDTFRPTHGVDGKSGHKHGAFTVVGILKPTGTPNDNALFVNIEGFYRVGGHAGKAGGPARKTSRQTKPEEKPNKPETKPLPRAEDEHRDEHDDEHDEHNDDSRQPEAGQRRAGPHLSGERGANPNLEGRNQQGAEGCPGGHPSEEITRLFEEIIGNIEVVLLVFAVMIVLVAGIGIMVSIYNSMNDRRHEIAIMRALGARRSTVMMVILLESILLSLGGGLLGLGMGHGLLAIAGPWIAEKVNLPLSMLQFRASS